MKDISNRLGWVCLYLFLISNNSFGQGPGNVTTSLEVWLKSNAGTFSDAGSTAAVDTDGLEQWNDQAGSAQNATESTNPPTFNNNSTDNLNFYPTIEFDGTDDEMTITLSAIKGTDYSLFVIGIRSDANSENYPVGSAGGGGTNEDLAFGYSDNTTAILSQGSNDLTVTINAFNSPAETPYLLFGEFDNTTGHLIREHRDGTETENTNVEMNGLSGSQQNFLGKLGSDFYGGKVSEIIAYSDNLAASDEARIESYLAYKYGITLDQTAATDYVASDGTTEMWDKDAAEATTYDNDIAGIGRDNNSVLAQPEGKSANTDAILTISADGEGSNLSPSFTDIADLEFLSWGNDDGTATWTSTDAPDNYALLTRKWSVQETGDVAAVTVAFDVEDGDFDVPALLSGTSYFVIIDTDDDGSLNDETPQQLFDDGTNGDDTASDNVWSLSGIDFDTGEDFTLATSATGPAGLTNALTLWLKADAGVTTSGSDVTSWADQSAEGNDATQGTTDNQPDLESGSINGNAVIDFDGTDDVLTLTGTADVEGTNLFSIFTIFRRENDADADAFLGAGMDATSDFSYFLTSADVQAVDDNTANNFTGSGTFATNAIGLTGVVRTAGNTFQFYSSGATDGTSGSIPSFAGTFTSNSLEIGRSFDNPFNGDLAEIIVYGAAKTDATELSQIQSYLALKYGITKSGDYLSSAGTTIWDATTNASYLNDIAGIGRDDLSALDQRSSKSINTSSEITLANGNNSSPTAFSADGSFLIWGHDNNDVTFGSTVANGQSGTSPRMNRVWRVQETSAVGTVEISFDNSLATGDVSIVIHPSNTTFPADAERRVADMTDNGSDYEVIVNFEDGEFFSFANANTSTVAFTSVVINEVITEPQQDWGASGFFDASPGGTGTDGSDEWIELLINEAGLDLTLWMINLNDGTNVSGTLSAGGAFQTSNYLSTSGGSFTSTRVGDYLILGNVTGGSMDNDITVILTDGSNTIDQVALGTEGNGPSGNSSGTSDESVSRIPNGQDLNDDANDLFLTRATLGTTNSPSGTAVINEVITDPQQDWSSIAFSGTAPGGTPGTDDEWVEILITSDGFNLTGWTIELVDGTDVTGDLTSSGAFQVTSYTAAGGGSFVDTRTGDFLVLGDVAGSGTIDDNVQITLNDASGNTIDQVQLGGGGGQAPSGASTGANDESISRYPNGTDTDTDDADFIQTIATLGSDNSLTGTIVVNEVVTDPQQDWSTNGFNGTNGGDVINTDDEWIELFISTAGINLTQWTIELNDGTNVSGELTTAGGGIFGATRYTASGSGSFLSTEVGDFLVLGNPSGDMDDDVQVVLRDASGTIVDQVQLGGGGGQAPSGNATTEADEAIGRLPNGTDTDTDNADFSQTPASMGATNSLTPLPSVGNALDFDGSNDHVVIADDNNLDITGALTIEAWVNLTSTSGATAGVVSKYEDTGNQRSYALQLNTSDQPVFGITSDGSTPVEVTATSAVSSSTWHHLAAVFNPSTSLRVYLDGILVGENTTSIPATIHSGTAPLWIAAVSDVSVADNLVNALIDEVRIWDDIRSQEELCENKFTTVDDGEANLVVYYRFDRSSGTTLSDLGANNLDGSLTNMDDPTDWVAAGWPVFAENAAILDDGATTTTTGISSELTITNVSFLNDSQDKILIGHNVQEFSEVTTDLPAGTLVTNRIDRTWHFETNDGAGTVGGDVSLTFSVGASRNDDFTYYLLERAGTSGDFSIVPVKGITSSGTTVAFTVDFSELDNDSYYTIGRSDEGPGNALNFDDAATADDVSFGDVIIDGLAALTVEAWIRPTAFPPGTSTTADIRSIITKGDNVASAGAFGIYFAGDGSSSHNLLFEVDNGTTKVTASFAVTSNINLNEWQHIALTWAAGQGVNAYLNGVLMNTSATLSGTIADIADALLIGSSTDTDEDNYQGEIDEVRIWSVERSQEEIIANFFQNISSTDADIANLEGYYRFNQGIGNSDTNLPDHSGDDFNGTLNNFDNLNQSSATEISNYVDVTNNATASKNRDSFFDNALIINPVTGASTLTASSDELTLTSTESDYLLNDNDFIAFGNDNGGFTETTNDVPTNTLVTNRITKTWNLDKNDASSNDGNVTFTFDLGSAPNPDRTYYLLKRSGTTGNFEVVEVIGSLYNGNDVEFTVDGAQIDDTFYYTVGRSGSGPGNALDFDGTDDVVSIADANALDLSDASFTIEFWANSDQTTGTRTVISKDNGDSDMDYQVRQNGNLWQFRARDAGLDISSTTTITAGTDYHVAAVFDGSEGRIYINGVEEAFTTTIGTARNNAEAVTVGASTASTPANFFDGTIDELRIWNVVRTQNELQQNMHRTLDVDTEAGLVAYYRFNQGIAGGTNTSPDVDLLPDQSDNDNSGAVTNFTLTGSTSNWVASQAVVSDQNSAQALIGPGNALDFDGTDDYVLIGDDATLDITGALTLEAWLNLTTTPPSADEGVVAKYLTAGNQLSYSLEVNTSGQPTFDISDDGSTVTSVNSTGALTTSSWAHLAAVYDPGNSMRIYLNGVLDGELTSGVPASIFGSSAELWIGMTSAVAANNAINGIIDEVRIWSTIRTEAEIQDNMYKELVGNETGLVSYYKFDELIDASSTSLPDQTVNANDGTLTNMDEASDWVTATAREPFKTTNTGAWNSASTWKSRTVPNAPTAILDLVHNVTLNVSVDADRVNVNSGTTLTLGTSNTLTSDNDIINNGTVTGAGVLLLNSGSPMLTGGTFSNIDIDAATNVTLLGNTTLTGTLDLIDGTITLDDFNLTVNSITGFAGPPDNDFVITRDQNTSGGFLTINISSSDGQVTFPVGTNSDYTPVTILNLGSNGNLNVRVFDGVFSLGTSGTDISSGDEVLKSWEITGAAGVNVTITFQWNSGDEGGGFTTERTGGGNDEIFVSKNDGFFWLPITSNGTALGADPFTMSASGISTFSAFALGAGSSPLPVGLVAFTATAGENRVYLDWQTVTEIENDHFEIQRSKDGETFDRIGIVNGNGSSTKPHDYTFIDTKPFDGFNYYRLRQVDFDGSFEYSKIVSANILNNSTFLKVYPNPFKNVFTVDFEKDIPMNSDIRLTTITGRVLSYLTLREDVRSLQVDMSTVPNGIYFIQINTGSESYIERLSKE